MQIKFHQIFSARPKGIDQADYWANGVDFWVDGEGYGSVRVNGEWLLDTFGNRRTFKTRAGAEKAARKWGKDQKQDGPSYSDIMERWQNDRNAGMGED